MYFLRFVVAQIVLNIIISSSGSYPADTHLFLWFCTVRLIICDHCLYDCIKDSGELCADRLWTTSIFFGWLVAWWQRAVEYLLTVFSVSSIYQSISLRLTTPTCCPDQMALGWYFKNLRRFFEMQTAFDVYALTKFFLEADEWSPAWSRKNWEWSSSAPVQWVPENDGQRQLVRYFEYTRDEVGTSCPSSTLGLAPRPRSSTRSRQSTDSASNSSRGSPPIGSVSQRSTTSRSIGLEEGSITDDDGNERRLPNGRPAFPAGVTERGGILPTKRAGWSFASPVRTPRCRLPDQGWPAAGEVRDYSRRQNSFPARQPGHGTPTTSAASDA